MCILYDSDKILLDFFNNFVKKLFSGDWGEGIEKNWLKGFYYYFFFKREGGGVNNIFWWIGFLLVILFMFVMVVFVFDLNLLLKCVIIFIGIYIKYESIMVKFNFDVFIFGW